MIEISHVSFSYAEDQGNSLKDLSLTIPEGQCVLLCGQSGSGKTTVSRLINGLIPNYFEGQMTGSVTVNGLDVSKAELYETARLVGSVFQNPRSQFFCVDTTSEIAFGCENMGLPEPEILDRVEKVQKDLHLEGLMDRSIFELSGGEKQKIACASVSALDPQVYVLDEPTSNLDVNAIQELRRTIALWKSRGKTIVIAEHRLCWLTELCDRVICMEDGAVGFDLPMAEFRSFPEEKLADLGLRSLGIHMDRDPSLAYLPRETFTLHDFRFSYDGTPALDIPLLELPVGGIIAVIGSNGAGKSTFSRCLCGLQKGFRGWAQVKGQKLKRRGLLRKCYLVMQDVNHQLFCESVEEEVQLGMEEENAPQVREVLDRLDLLPCADRHPMSLSGGQKQRVAIASSILADKELLLFDEPTSGLDRRHMEQTGAFLSGLRGQKTLLIVTHDPELICRCCTHVLQLDHGRVSGCYALDEQGFPKVREFFLHQERRS